MSPPWNGHQFTALIPRYILGWSLDSPCFPWLQCRYLWCGDGSIDAWAEADEAWAGMDPQWHKGAELHQNRGVRAAGAGEPLCPYKHTNLPVLPWKGCSWGTGTPEPPQRCRNSRRNSCVSQDDGHQVGAALTQSTAMDPGCMMESRPTLSSLSYSLQGWNTDLCPRSLKSGFHNTFQWYSATGWEVMAINIQSQIPLNVRKSCFPWGWQNPGTAAQGSAESPCLKTSQTHLDNPEWTAWSPEVPSNPSCSVSLPQE